MHRNSNIVVSLALLLTSLLIQDVILLIQQNIGLPYISFISVDNLILFHESQCFSQ